MCWRLIVISIGSPGSIPHITTGEDKGDGQDEQPPEQTAAEYRAGDLYGQERRKAGHTGNKKAERMQIWFACRRDGWVPVLPAQFLFMGLAFKLGIDLRFVAGKDVLHGFFAFPLKVLFPSFFCFRPVSFAHSTSSLLFAQYKKLTR